MRPIAHLFQVLGVAAVALGIVSLQVRNEGVLKLLVFPYVRDKGAIFLTNSTSLTRTEEVLVSIMVTTLLATSLHYWDLVSSARRESAWLCWWVCAVNPRWRTGPWTALGDLDVTSFGSFLIQSFLTLVKIGMRHLPCSLCKLLWYRGFENMGHF